MKQALVLALVALSASACAVEHRTVVVADDPCTSYGYTASSAEAEGPAAAPAAFARGSPMRLPFEISFWSFTQWAAFGIPDQRLPKKPLPRRLRTTRRLRLPLPNNFPINRAPGVSP